MYSVKEIFYSLQGEGAHSGRPAVFVRFAGCNLWNGLEESRESATCQFCDTDFVGINGLNGGKFKSADELASKATEIANIKQYQSNLPLMVICTGGEPLLQVDEPLIEAFKAQGFYVAVETNGTIKAPAGFDWICVSPKAGSEIIQQQGNELKVVFGQSGMDLSNFLTWRFEHFYLQPMDGPAIDQSTQETIAYCKANPSWKLSLQNHKILNIP